MYANYKSNLDRQATERICLTQLGIMCVTLLGIYIYI